MKSLSIPLIFLLAAAACTPSTKLSTSAPVIPSQVHLLQSTLFVQQAAEYDALCYQAYEVARQRLLNIINSGVEKPAVVLDLDETVLDNSPYTAWQITSNQTFTPETWAKWVDLAEAEAVPGAAAFLHFADSLGAAIFYISNRDENQLDATILNMKKLRLPQSTPSQFLLKQATSDKSSRREAVKSRGHDIVMLIGDNLGDFSEKWDKPATTEDRKSDVSAQRSAFGNTFIVLPNPVYGTWEGAMQGYRRDYSPSQLDSLRRSALRPAKIR
jgi:5'-nucleotidase (lipoprotein e(P4) family)